MADTEKPSDPEVDGILANYEELLDRETIRPNAYMKGLTLRSEIQEFVSECLGDAYRDAVRRHGPLRSGQRFGKDGKYLIIKAIGRGGHGHVYLAETPIFQTSSETRHVALKILNPTAHNEHASARFRREQLHASQIVHPNLVAVYEAEDYDGDQYIAMLYVPGDENGDRTLSDWLTRREPNGAAQEAFAIQWLLGIAKGIQALHHASVIHRDIKPHNILLWRAAETVQVLVADLGLARSSEDTLITRPHIPVGTPSYIAPEQMAGAACDERSDLYSFGVTAYQFLTGRLPFHSPKLPPNILIHPTPLQQSVPLSVICPELDIRLEEIVMRCLAPNPDNRISQIDLVVEALQDIIQTPDLSRVSRWRRLAIGLRRLNRRVSPVWRQRLVPASLFIVILILIAIWNDNWKPSAFRFKSSASVNSSTTVPIGIPSEQKPISDQQGPASRVANSRVPLELRLHQQILAEAQSSLDQGNHDAAFLALQKVEQADATWAEGYLWLQLASLPYCREVVSVHDWGVSTGLLHADGQSLLTFGSDGRVVATPLFGGETQELQTGVWDTSAQRWLPAIHLNVNEQVQDKPDSECVTQVTSLGPQLESFVTVSQTGRAGIWNWSENKLSQQRTLIERHPCPLTAVCSSSDGQELILGDAEGRLFRSVGQDTVQPIEVRLQASPIMDLVRLSASTVAVAQADGSISCLSSDGKKLRYRQTYSKCAWDLDVSLNGNLLAVATADPEVLLLRWNEEDSVLRQESRFPMPVDVEGEFSAVHAVRLSPSGHLLAAGDNLGRFALWDIDRSQPAFVEHQEKRDAYLKARSTWPPWMQKTYRGFEFYDEERRVASYGCDGVLKLWHLQPDTRGSVAPLPRHPLLHAAPGHPNWIWTAGEQSLSVRNVVTNELIEVDAGQLICSLSSLATTVDGTVAATGDTAGNIRFWQWRDGHISPNVREPLKMDGAVTALAIEPLGSNVAALDTTGLLRQWTIAKTGAATTQDSHIELPVRPILAYNSDGRLLAGSAPGQGVLIFDTRNLLNRQHPPLAAGLGATSLFWPPTLPSALIAGDTDGSLRIHSVEHKKHPDFKPKGLLSSVAGLTLCQPGNLLAAISERGFVRLIPLAGGDPLFSFSIRREVEPGNPITCAVSDASGKHLVVGSEKGTLEVMKTVPALKRPPMTKSAAWTQQEIIRSEGPTRVNFRDCSVQPLPKGSLAILHASTPRTPGSQFREELIRLSVWKDGTCTHHPISQIDAGKQPSVDGEVRSLNLCVSDNSLWSAYRHPSPEEGPYQGTIRLQQWSVGPNETLHAIPIGELDCKLIGNHGFDLHTSPGISGKPTLWHFSHSGHYFLRTIWNGTDWITSTIGRQGDGFKHVGQADLTGQFHALFRPNRYNTEPGVPVYLSVDPNTNNEFREVFDRIPVFKIYSVTVHDRMPKVLYARRSVRDRTELVLGERREGNWQLETLLEWEAFETPTISNLVFLSPTSIGFAAQFNQPRRLLWIERRGTNLTQQVIQEFPEELQFDEGLVARIQDQELLVISAQNSETAAFVRLYQTKLPAPQ
ncbi:MAG: hypothetical protein JWM11_6835 [Planctomycetaceae bacterium]|nr:hypothetical protein [Planctomycetaceae bacterium]